MKFLIASVVLFSLNNFALATHGDNDFEYEVGQQLSSKSFSQLAGVSHGDTDPVYKAGVALGLSTANGQVFKISRGDNDFEYEVGQQLSSKSFVQISRGDNDFEYEVGQLLSSKGSSQSLGITYVIRKAFGVGKTVHSLLYQIIAPNNTVSAPYIATFATGKDGQPVVTSVQLAQ